MIRKELLLTTAIVMAGSLAFIARSAAEAKQVVAGEPAQRTNFEFLCTYGSGIFEVSNFPLEGSSASYYSGWAHIAVPIVGRGRIVSSITVKEEKLNHFNDTISLGIYSNTASGVPGDLISGGKSKVLKHCSFITTPIVPTKLERNKTYWIEETIPRQREYRDSKTGWAVNPHTKLRAYKQFYRFNGGLSSSYLSPWTEQSGGPYVRVR